VSTTATKTSCCDRLPYRMQTAFAARRRAERRSEALLGGKRKGSVIQVASVEAVHGEIVWSEETFRIFQYDRSTKPTVELVPPASSFRRRCPRKLIIERASRDAKDFDLEHRLADARWFRQTYPHCGLMRKEMSRVKSSLSER